MEPALVGPCAAGGRPKAVGWREVLPSGDRLPASPHWQGADADELMGRKRHGGENRTPRTPPANIDRLLLWSLRFVHDFADDIHQAHPLVQIRRDPHSQLTSSLYPTRA